MPPRHSTKGILLSIISVLMMSVLPAYGQEVSVSYSANTTWVDTPIQVQFTIEGTQEIGEPILPEQDGLQFDYLGVTQDRSGMEIKNGVRRSYRMVGLTISVTPIREGAFEIEPITIDINGKPLQQFGNRTHRD